MTEGIRRGNGHLAVFNTNLEIGGTSRVLVNLIRELDARGYRIDLLLASASGEFVSEIPTGVRVVELERSTAPGIGVLASVLPLRNYLREVRPDTLLSAKPHTNLVAVIARQLASVPTRTVISRHTMTSHQLRYLDDAKHKLVVFLSKYVYPYADAIVAVSDGVMADVSEVLGIPKDRFSVIHNPIVTPQLVEKSEGEIDHPWFRDDAPPVILSVGRLHPQKNYSMLIEAFAALPEDDARLMILGEGETRPELESLVSELGLEGEVALPGSTPNPYPYMREASVLALSSVTEALPSTLIEAMACGCPVVATRCSSGPVEILRDGEFGQLVPVNDVDAMAEALASTLRRPPESAKLRNRAMDFSAENVAGEYERVLFPKAKRRETEEVVPTN